MQVRSGCWCADEPSWCGVWQVVSRGQYTCHTNTQQYTIWLHADQGHSGDVYQSQISIQIIVCKGQNLEYSFVICLVISPVCVMTAVVTHSWHVMNITRLMTAGRGGAGAGADWEWHILAAILQHSPTLQICNNWQRGGTQHHGVTRRTVQYIAFESPVPGPI